MAVLTIARELGSISDGEEFVLCNTLKLHCVSKSTLETRFAELGIERGILERFDECNPGFASFFSSSAGVYWDALQAVLLQELLTDNVAIIGRGGNFLLRNLVDCFRLRLVAPLEQRVHRLSVERNCSEDAALKAIRQSDSAREKFCRYYYSADWRDPLAYDMVINTAEVSLEKVAEFLPDLLPPSAEGPRKEQLECAVREQMIRHALFTAWNCQPVSLDILCTPDGTVVLQGCVHSEEAAEYSVKIAESVPGVKTVKNELFVAIADIGMPVL